MKMNRHRINNDFKGNEERRLCSDDWEPQGSRGTQRQANRQTDRQTDIFQRASSAIKRTHSRPVSSKLPHLRERVYLYTTYVNAEMLYLTAVFSSGHSQNTRRSSLRAPSRSSCVGSRGWREPQQYSCISVVSQTTHDLRKAIIAWAPDLRPRAEVLKLKAQARHPGSIAP